MALVLSDELVEDLKTERPQRDFYDAEFRGGSFLVRVSRGGRKSYVMAYRFRGRRRRLTLGHHPDRGLAEVRREARRLVEALESGVDPRLARGGTPPPTLREFYERRFAPDHVETRGRLRGSTRSHYRWAFRKHILASDLADLALGKITEADVERLAGRVRRSGCSEAAVAGVLNCLAKCFRSAGESGLVARSPAIGPARRARRNMGPGAAPRPLGKGEAERLLAAARDACPEPAFQIILTALHTGLRPGELRALKWEDVDLAARLLTVGRMSGGGSERQVPLSDALTTALGRWKLKTAGRTARAAPPSGWVFPNRAGRRIDWRNFKRRWFRQAARRAGLDGLQFKSLRDTCAVLLLQAGLRLERLSAQLGDAHPGVTAKRYTPWLPGGGREAWNDLPVAAPAG